MRGAKNKKNGNKWKRLGIFLLLLLVFGFLFNSVLGVYKKKKVAEKALNHMKAEVATLQKRDQSLKESIARMATQEGLSFEIRKKLNVAGVGESVAVIVEEQQPPSVPSTSTSSWQKFKDFFVWLFK